MQIKVDRIASIRFVLEHFVVFQQATGVQAASFDWDLDQQAVEVQFADGMLTVRDQGGSDWTIPLVLFGPPSFESGVQGQSGDSEGTEDTGEATDAMLVGYTVVNREGQVGGKTWESIDALVQELAPLREDLQVIALEPEGQPRQLNQYESIRLGMVLSGRG
jgi:hypothetical protein